MSVTDGIGRVESDIETTACISAVMSVYGNVACLAVQSQSTHRSVGKDSRVSLLMFKYAPHDGNSGNTVDYSARGGSSVGTPNE